MDQSSETQTIELLLVNEWEIKFFPFFPQKYPQVLRRLDSRREAEGTNQAS
jgi:hypothetical protein